jgi:hypothetical protein
VTLPTHLLLGAIIGKLTGNYALAITSSLAPDLDHLNSYVKSGVIKSWKSFWNTISVTEDPYGDQRGYLHNVGIFLVVSIVLFFVSYKLALVIVLSWFGHLLLDTLDSSDYWPLYPNKFNIRGPIKYYSLGELLFALILMLIYLLI